MFFYTDGHFLKIKGQFISNECNLMINMNVCIILLKYSYCYDHYGYYNMKI